MEETNIYNAGKEERRLTHQTETPKASVDVFVVLDRFNRHFPRPTFFKLYLRWTYESTASADGWMQRRGSTLNFFLPDSSSTIGDIWGQRETKFGDKSAWRPRRRISTSTRFEASKLQTISINFLTCDGSLRSDLERWLRSTFFFPLRNERHRIRNKGSVLRQHFLFGVNER